jgi:tetratricopeptide (TPR) repeat protein
VPDEIRAWARFANGDIQGAISLLRPVADRQAKVGKGEVELPAREMMAEMFLLSGKFTEALTAYRASLVSDPNRFNALLGAGEAAEQLKRRKIAATYYRALLANCSGATGTDVGELRHAQSHPRTSIDPRRRGRRAEPLRGETDARWPSVRKFLQPRSRVGVGSAGERRTRFKERP